MVEQAPKPFAALQENARIVGAGSRVEIVRADALKFANSAGRRFDLLFLDPPYRQGWIDRLIPQLPKLLTEDAAIYVEAETALDACGEWQTVKQGKAGQVFYHLMRRGSPEGGR